MKDHKKHIDLHKLLNDNKVEMDRLNGEILRHYAIMGTSRIYICQHDYSGYSILDSSIKYCSRCKHIK